MTSIWDAVYIEDSKTYKKENKSSTFWSLSTFCPSNDEKYERERRKEEAFEEMEREEEERRLKKEKKSKSKFLACFGLA